MANIQKKCIQIRKLSEEGKIDEALSIVDEFEGVLPESVRDLRIIADLQEKAGRLVDMKKTYDTLCEFTKTHHVLRDYIFALIRMGDLGTARERLNEFEANGGATEDDFEMRYAILEALGVPRDEKIRLLEDFKKEEYIESWARRLAQMYKDAGREEDYSAEMADINLWFGGARFIAEEEVVDPRDDSEVHDEIEENLAARMVDNSIEDDISVHVAEEVNRIVSGRKPKPESEEIPDEAYEEEEPEEYEEEDMVPDAPIIESVGEVRTASGASVPDENRESFEPGYLNNLGPAETVGEPVVSERGHHNPEIENLFKVDDDYEEGPEDISERGIRYWTPKDTIAKVRRGDIVPPHFVLAGGTEKATLAMAKKLSKELTRLGYNSARKVVKINSQKLNSLDLMDQIDRLVGSCLLVTEAAELDAAAVEGLERVVYEFGEEFVVMLSAPFDEMDCFLEIYPELEKALGYKVRMLL